MKLFEFLKLPHRPTFQPVRNTAEADDTRCSNSELNFASLIDEGEIELRFIERDELQQEEEEEEESVPNIYNSLSEDIRRHNSLNDGNGELEEGVGENGDFMDAVTDWQRRLLQRQLSTISGHVESTPPRSCRRLGILLISSAILIVISTLLVTGILLRHNWHLLEPQKIDEMDSNPQHLKASHRDGLTHYHSWPIPDINSLNNRINKTQDELPGIFKLDLTSTENPENTNSKNKDHEVNHKRKTIIQKFISPKIIRESYTLAMKSFSNYSNLTLQQQHSVHGLLMEKSYNLIGERMNLSLKDLNHGEILLNGSLPFDLCPIELHSLKIKCNITEVYRRFDGHCNNLKNPLLGSSHQAFRRMAFPLYADGVSLPSHDDRIPSVRFVSEQIHGYKFNEDPKASQMLNLWGHFIGHDLYHVERHDKSCCESQDSDSCFQISVPSSDSFYSRFNITCLNYVRAEPMKTCKFGPRELVNIASSFLDGSHIYGATRKISDSLRTFKDGMMKLYDSQQGLILLPLWNEGNSTCLNDPNITTCFLSGDLRVNDFATITAMQTIWVRNHNAIAQTLGSLNPHWDDHKRFETARSITIAQLQHITFSEFLPELLPPEILQDAKLLLQKDGYYTLYEVDVDPSISVEASIALQFVHSMTQVLMMKKGFPNNNEEYVQYHRLVGNSSIFFLKPEDYLMDKLLWGLASQNAAKVDVFVSGQLTNHYKQSSKSDYGTDLIALTLQWSRDAGVAPYTKYWHKCGQPKIKDFNDLNSTFWDSEVLHRVKQVYKSVDDIDLFTGILSEKPLKSGRLGPTLSCIIADTFSRLKQGDMFWYEGDIRKGHFTPAQLSSLRTTSLARIICDNSDKITRIQENVMLKISPQNPEVSCHSIPHLNLRPWRHRRMKLKSKQSSTDNDMEEESFPEEKEKESWVDVQSREDSLEYHL